jgi:UrcA family protein
MRRIVIAAVGANLIIGFLPASVNAGPSWSKDPTVTEQVNYADLDLSSAAAQKRLRDRISFAAYRLCLVDSPATPAPSIADPVCFRKSMEDAMAQMERAVARASGSQTLAQATH